MDDITIPVDLGKSTGMKDLMTQEKLISYKKIISQIYKDSQQKSKRNRCFCCNELCNSFCNSHTVPAFCLEYIATKGKLLYINTMIDNPLLKKDKGINDAGTFHIICRECDSKIFQEYENEKNYDRIPSTKMLAQIAMKNYLKLISKIEFDNVFYEEICRRYAIPNPFISLRYKTTEIDFKGYFSAFNKAQKSSLKPFDGDYHIYTYIELPYIIPIAFQGSVALICDLEGNVINDIYNINDKYEIKNLRV